MLIKPATLADAPAIEACAHEAYSPYIADIGRAPAPMIADFAGQIGAGIVFVAQVNQRVVGFIVFFAREDHMFLENVAVCDAARGLGVGKALIGFCEEQARRLGLGGVGLYTNAKMTRNLTLYPRLGYVETDRRSEDGFDRVYFRKTLDQGRAPPASRTGC
ncbi:MAG: GNAT family N-acetyltransferase [Pseudomonadota bacterium]